MQATLNSHGYIMNTTSNDGHKIKFLYMHDQYPRKESFCGEIT
jgi:hypothetical protein